MRIPSNKNRRLKVSILWPFRLHFSINSVRPTKTIRSLFAWDNIFKSNLADCPVHIFSVLLVSGSKTLRRTSKEGLSEIWRKSSSLTVKFFYQSVQKVLMWARVFCARVSLCESDLAVSVDKDSTDLYLSLVLRLSETLPLGCSYWGVTFLFTVLQPWISLDACWCIYLTTTVSQSVAALLSVSRDFF